MFTVVVPTYNRNEDLIRCLESIRQKSYYENEIIVLASTLTQDLMDICSKYEARFIPDASRANGKRVKSLWGIINLGIESSIFDFVLWLNDDCVVLDNWDQAVYKYFSLNVGLVVLKTSGICNDKKFLIAPSLFGVPCANYAVIRKSTGIRFDENFSWFHGDSDIPLQMLEATTFRVVSTDEGLVRHLHRQDEARKENEEDSRTTADSLYFYKKWSNKKRLGNGKIVVKNAIDIILDLVIKNGKHFIKKHLPWIRKSNDSS